MPAFEGIRWILFLVSGKKSGGAARRFLDPRTDCYLSGNRSEVEVLGEELAALEMTSTVLCGEGGVEYRFPEAASGRVIRVHPLDHEMWNEDYLFKHPAHRTLFFTSFDSTVKSYWFGRYALWKGLFRPVLILHDHRYNDFFQQTMGDLHSVVLPDLIWRQLRLLIGRDDGPAAGDEPRITSPFFPSREVSILRLEGGDVCGRVDRLEGWQTGDRGGLSEGDFAVVPAEEPIPDRGGGGGARAPLYVFCRRNNVHLLREALR